MTMKIDELTRILGKAKAMDYETMMADLETHLTKIQRDIDMMELLSNKLGVEFPDQEHHLMHMKKLKMNLVSGIHHFSELATLTRKVIT